MAHVKFLIHLNGISGLFSLFMMYAYWDMPETFWSFFWGAFFCFLAVAFLQFVVVKELKEENDAE